MSPFKTSIKAKIPNLAAPLTPLCGTLVCPGIPVRNHWLREWKLVNFGISYILSFWRCKFLQNHGRIVIEIVGRPYLIYNKLGMQNMTTVKAFVRKATKGRTQKF